MKNKELVDIYVPSAEVQDILEFIPHWLIRWGCFAILSFVLILIGISFIVSYPDVIRGNTILTTQTPPIRVESKLGGIASKVNVINSEIVEAGDTLAIVENIIDEESIHFLKDLLAIGNNLTNDDFSYHDFGPINPNYLALKAAVAKKINLINSSNYSQQKEHIENQIQNLIELNRLNLSQEKLQLQKIDNYNLRFTNQEKLFYDSVISNFELLNEKELVLNQNTNLNQIRKLTYENRLKINNYKQELNELTYRTDQSIIKVREEISVLRVKIQNQIDAWRKESLILSPIGGIVFKLDDISQFQVVKPNQELFVVIPKVKDYYLIAVVEDRGFGKVEIDQRVKIELDNYPSHEFGSLYGKVNQINPIPFKSNYKIYIKLEQGLETNQGKKLMFYPEMTGQIEIITENKKLIDRFLINLLKVKTITT